MAEGYKGDVDVRTCWQALAGEPDSFLVDVRTHAEWSYVGLPDLQAIGRAPVLIEWQSYPSMAVAPDFAERLAEAVTQAGGSTQSSLYFLCRSGVRSIAGAVAATRAGFANSYNVLDGFEGPPDEEAHRGRLAGWKAAGLPWSQR
ncbi:rhodanese-like domain-containing protein [Antarcticirhabdus aurantiaca]|uniref:Rhodanese-like domain-containing protein n=1 Tax=Antarcticirhabdus aurantiaca TaxID=2606717 RepID=A0ACD4NLN1_9HYPH|nr:rhodanese-like domain-containing protein [Antarcticirhabdus aurantiaca]WAJ27753.1 rhodanese-like domain-containing protein [Jeongeuplla avenae]